MDSAFVWIFLIVVAIGAGYTIKVRIANRSSTSKNLRITTQKNNNAGGDIIGGDSTKTTKK